MSGGDKADVAHLLVLTATITPITDIHLVRRDPEVRRADYLRAFRFWLQHEDPRLSRILFAENSGADLSEFREETRQSLKQVEIISVPAEPPPAGVHYGYSELLMVDAALRRSELRKTTTHLIKATGRLIFPDLPKLLDRLPPTFELAVDTRRNLPGRNSSRGFIPTQLLLVSHRFYDAHLRKSYLDLRADYPHFIENLFYDLVMDLPRTAGMILRWPVNCEPVGFAAHASKRYDGAKRIMVTRLRSVLRVVAPRLWF